MQNNIFGVLLSSFKTFSEQKGLCLEDSALQKAYIDLILPCLSHAVPLIRFF